jgi:16S rRNA (cytosine1402-N4)-methyltransferase
MVSTYHQPVLLHECIDYLNIRPGGIYVDGTLGGGGHSEAILERAVCRVLAFDADSDAIAEAGKRLIRYGNRFTAEQTNFRYLRQTLEKHRIPFINGLLLDLGVSSHQLDRSAKGFSYRFDAPLGMQMNDRESFNAREIINSYDEKDMADIFFRLGEEKNSRRIARAIAEARRQRTIETTGQLTQIISRVIPERFSKKTLSRVFQALRIKVNDELNNLVQILGDSIDALAPEGRIAVISYHSLEDRIVKDFFKKEVSDKILDSNYPELSQSKQPRLRLITRKPIMPQEEEIAGNPRARSAKLRVAEKI